MTNQPKVSLENLQVKVQSMLDGEKKRREVAIQFTNILHNILIDVAEDIWGNGESNYFDNYCKTMCRGRRFSFFESRRFCSGGMTGLGGRRLLNVVGNCRRGRGRQK